MGTRQRIVIAAFTLGLLLFAVWEATHGRWAVLVSLLVAASTYLLVPRLEALSGPEPDSRSRASMWQPVREYLWAFVAFWIALLLFVLVRAYVSR